MIKILFVCHGNICRSPMAEFIFTHLVRERGLFHMFTIASAATSSEEIWNGVGNPVHPGTRRVLARKGIPAWERQATQLVKSDYLHYDYLVGMDSNNMRNMNRLFGRDTEGKCHLLMEFSGSHADVADPWYTGDFERTYRDISRGCEDMLDWILSNQHK